MSKNLKSEIQFKSGTPEYAHAYYLLQKERGYKYPPVSTKIEKLRKRLYRYNLSPVEFSDMLVKQDSSCAICSAPFNEIAPCVDHCHTSGKIRGLLCRNCNSGLGLFHDDLTSLSNAMRYLIESS